MTKKEMRARTGIHERATVRKHESILARIQGEPLPLTDRELWILGSAFTAVSLGFVLMGIAL